MLSDINMNNSPKKGNHSTSAHARGNTEQNERLKSLRVLIKPQIFLSKGSLFMKP